MITNVKIENFTAVPYFEGSALAATYPTGIDLSSEKPNVIVGPNGAGKSAFMKALALQTLSLYTGESNLDNNYISGTEAETYWAKAEYWHNVDTQDFLPGLHCVTDNAPALYYRPGQIPGDEDSIAHAMMTGYFDEAKAYAKLVESKSAGQQCQAVLQRIQATLSGDATAGPKCYAYVNWNYGRKPVVIDRHCYTGSGQLRAEALRSRYASIPAAAVPLILMDEPEQSLDAWASATLWSRIAEADCAKVQIVVATHSWYPILHPEAFNIIEAVPGFLEEVRSLIQ